MRGQPSGSDVRRLLVCAKFGLQLLALNYPCILRVFDYCIVCSFDCVSVLSVIKYFTKYTLCCRTYLTTLSHLLAVGERETMLSTYAEVLASGGARPGAPAQVRYDPDVEVQKLAFEKQRWKAERED